MQDKFKYQLNYLGVSIKVLKLQSDSSYSGMNVLTCTLVVSSQSDCRNHWFSCVPREHSERLLHLYYYCYCICRYSQDVCGFGNEEPISTPAASSSIVPFNGLSRLVNVSEVSDLPPAAILQLQYDWRSAGKPLYLLSHLCCFIDAASPWTPGAFHLLESDTTSCSPAFTSQQSFLLSFLFAVLFLPPFHGKVPA